MAKNKDYCPVPIYAFKKKNLNHISLNKKMNRIFLESKFLFISSTQFISDTYPCMVKIEFCIPESFNTNISHQLFDYTITFVNSQH